MDAIFPQEDWIHVLVEKLNSDEKYARVAKNWEGDLLFDIEPDEILQDRKLIYLDLWHGRCRAGASLEDPGEREAAFVLRAPYGNFVRVLKGEWHPMQAMMTRKLHVEGNMVYMMRNVPTVLEFVRCCQDITTRVLGD
jgi:putative sterol carrier protein